MPFDAFQERGRALEAMWANAESARAVKALRASMGLESVATPVAPQRSVSEDKIDMGTMLRTFFTRGQ